MMRLFSLVPVVVSAWLILSCGSQDLSSLDLSQVGDEETFAKSRFPEQAAEILADLPSGEDQRKALCSRSGRDKVRQVFCGTTPPEIKSLKDLQRELGLAGPSGGGNNGGLFGGGIFGGLFGGGFLGGIFGAGGSSFAFTAASSSLVGRFTSAINPRLVMFSAPNGQDPNMVALGFVRGEQFAEVIARDGSSGKLNFFLVHFQQDCNDRPGGCNNGELLGPAIEANWRQVTVYEDSDIENTILDCKQCHQPGGVSSPKILRMQELRNPWTHFIAGNTNGGRALLAEFQRAHPGEEFAGIDANRISASNPAQLENFVRQNGFGNQPNEFPTAQIEGGGFGGFFGGIFGGGARGKAAWDPLYENFVKGEAIAPPYHQLRVADPAKQEKMTQAYLDLKEGKLQPKDFPDTRDVLLDSGLRDMGYMVKEGLTGEQILVQACSQCHNSRLNQEITRARFNVDLSKISKKAKEKAIARINLPDNDVKKMPPVRFRSLTPEEIKRVEEALSK